MKIFLAKARRRLALLATLTVLLFATSPAWSQTTGIFDGEAMSGVMSFNLRLEGDLGDRAWAKRRPVVASIINDYHPLFVGTQEGKHEQLEQMLTDLPGYRYLGVSRRGNTKDEYSALFYDSERATVLSHGDLWLSETPAVAGSTLAESGHPRMVTWGKFSLAGRERPIFVFNTHTAEQPELSQRQMAILLQQIATLTTPEDEVLVTGDFNVRRSKEAVSAFTSAGFFDAFELAAHRAGPDYSFHGWKGDQAASVSEATERSGRVIDWVFYRNGQQKPKEPLLVEILTRHDGPVFASDHYPVLLSSLGRAKAVTSDLTVEPRSVLPDATVRMSALVVNEGERGFVPVQLDANAKAEEVRWTLLDAGASQRVSFEKRYYVPGRYKIGINETPTQNLDVKSAPARVEITSLSAPPSVTPGIETEILATYRNLGGTAGQVEAALTVVGSAALNVTGDVAITQPVALEPGATTDIVFKHVFSEPGAFTVDVGGRKTQVSVAADFEEPWLFKQGDDLAWADPDYNDAEWARVQLPAAWEKHSGYLDDNAYGWYRTSLVVPAEWEGRSLRVLLGTIDDVDQTFINGVKVGQTGQMPDDSRGYRANALTVRSYTIPAALVRYGERNVLAIRVYDGLGDGGITRGPIGILPLGR